jgi:hypothetical protein
MAVAHDEASPEPQEEQSDKEMAETAAAMTTATAPRLSEFRVGGRGKSSFGSSLVAGRELIRRHRFHLYVHLFVGVGGEERALESFDRHRGNKGSWV